MMRKRFQSQFNVFLDAIARPEITILNHSHYAFRICGYAGLAGAMLLAIALAMYAGLSALTMTMIVLGSVLTFLALTMATKIITGYESIIYYHHEIAVIVMAAVLLWLFDQPLLPYLDITVVGLGIFLSCGRIGCLMAGCCHGRPNRWGICYRAEHAAAGFTRHYVGIRLLPIQAIESMWALCIVVMCSLMLVSHRPAGTAFASYVVAYDAGRFCFEFLRGDPDRPYYRGFSEAQWISAGLTLLIATAEIIGLLPLQAWHIGATFGFGAAMLIVAAIRSYWTLSRYKLLQPRHVKEVAEALEPLFRSAGENYQAGVEKVHMRNTSLGLQISTSIIRGSGVRIPSCALSYRNKVMNEVEASRLAELIRQLGPWPDSGELIKGNQGIFHLVFPPQPASEQLTVR